MTTKQESAAPSSSSDSDGMLADLSAEVRHLVPDTLAMTWRNLARYRRSPELLMFSTISPIMFVLLFNYVFGGAIGTGDLSYINYLIPGILIQTTIFGSTNTGVGLADDLQKGMVDRYRSLPMARSAVISGRIIADTLVNFFVAILMIGVGVAIGMRFNGGFWPAVALPFTVAGFSFGFSWMAALVGSSVRNVESASSALFMFVFPLTFISSAFVPVATMPGWLQPFAENNPVTIAVDLGRALSQGGPLVSDAILSLAWAAAMTLGFGALAVWQYKRN